MKVHLRQRKQTKDGKISLYLEIYKGTIKTEEGKTKALRDYEYLDLYLIDNPKNKRERQTNKETLELAKSIKAKRELEIKNGQYGFKRKGNNQNANFIEYYKKIVDRKEETKARGTHTTWDSAYKQMLKYAGEKVPFRIIDEDFCEGFKDHLCTVEKTSGDTLANSTIHSYFGTFRLALKEAVKDKIITYNPADDIELPTVKTPKKEHLTKEELRAVAKEECRYPVLKNAFMFACLTGLRWSDIQNLTWSNIEELDEGWRVTFHQQKTDGLQYHDIPENAHKYLGEREADDERVFKGLKYSSYMNVALQRWMMKAGITKNITFHCARHTYAILQLELGADIYTVSKLLGHKNLKTTQVYADIVDKKKREAVNRLNEIEL